MRVQERDSTVAGTDNRAERPARDLSEMRSDSPRIMRDVSRKLRECSRRISAFVLMKSECSIAFQVVEKPVVEEYSPDVGLLDEVIELLRVF